jgi:hypothetical protein
MKLSDVKHIIDAYFDTVNPTEVIKYLESQGYEFEPLEHSFESFNVVADSDEILCNYQIAINFIDTLDIGVTTKPKLILPPYGEDTSIPVGNYQYAMAA